MFMFEDSLLPQEENINQELAELELIREAELMRTYYDFLQGNKLQSNINFTFVLVSIHSFDRLVQQYGEDVIKSALMIVNEYLVKARRDSDLIFRIPTRQIWILLLTQSTNEEAEYFLRRVFQNVPSISDDSNQEIKLRLSGSVLEVNYSKMDFEGAFEKGSKALGEALKMEPSEIRVITSN